MYILQLITIGYILLSEMINTNDIFSSLVHKTWPTFIYCLDSESHTHTNYLMQK